MHTTSRDGPAMDQIEIRVKVVPRSSRNQVLGREGDVYRVKLTSPPVDGQANKALIELFSKRLGVAKGNIEIISGKHSKLKTIRIYGVQDSALDDLLVG